MQLTAAIGPAQRMKPLFHIRMSRIVGDDQRPIEKDLLGFGRRHVMLRGILGAIAVIPVEANDPIPIDHPCILPSYTHGNKPPNEKGGRLAGARLYPFEIATLA